jgi:hypothetical protein
LTEATAFRTFIILFSLFKSEHSSPSIILTLHKALIKSVMTYVCCAWGLVADTYTLKLQRLQYKVLRTIWKFPKWTSVRDLHTAFNFPYDYVTNLCRRQAEVIQNHEKVHIRSIGQGEARHRQHKGLDLSAVNFTTVQMTKLPL